MYKYILVIGGEGPQSIDPPHCPRDPQAFIYIWEGCFEIPFWGVLRSKLEVWETLLECILGLVGRKWGFGRPRGPREGIWKGLD